MADLQISQFVPTAPTQEPMQGRPNQSKQTPSQSIPSRNDSVQISPQQKDQQGLTEFELQLEYSKKGGSGLALSSPQQAPQLPIAAPFVEKEQTTSGQKALSQKPISQNLISKGTLNQEIIAQSSQQNLPRLAESDLAPSRTPISGFESSKVTPYQTRLAQADLAGQQVQINNLPKQDPSQSPPQSLHQGLHLGLQTMQDGTFPQQSNSGALGELKQQSASLEGSAFNRSGNSLNSRKLENAKSSEKLVNPRNINSFTNQTSIPVTDTLPLQSSAQAQFRGNNIQSKNVQMTSPSNVSHLASDLTGSALFINELADAEVGFSNGSELGQDKGIQARKKTWSGSLSGNEFIDTLGSVQLAPESSSEKMITADPFFAGIQNKSSQQTELPTGLQLNSIKKKQMGAGITGRNEEPNSSLHASLQASGQAFGMAAGTQSGIGSSSQMADVTAHVVPGAMSKLRIATDGLMNISSGIQKLSLQGGEMKIRLRPDNLGEIHLKVTTNGSNVGLKIQASDEKSKQIIEESLSYLKESLSAQNLALNQVDLSVLSTSNMMGNDDSKNSSQNSNSQNQNSLNMEGFNFNQQSMNGQMSGRDYGNSNQTNYFDNDGVPAARVSAMRRNGQSQFSQVDPSGLARLKASNGRLDVMA
jgi:hypothetical protein